MTHPPASGTPDAPPLPRPILSLGVTGNRENNAVYAAGAERVAAVIDGLFERIVALADRARAADAAVVAEIESWQAVFAGKHFTVPV